MRTDYADDSLALHTDLYQINMAESYWADNMHERKAIFELYFRKLPFGNGYAVFAGLERMLSYLKDFSFSESDIAYLREEVGYKDDFINYLKDVRFTGDMYAMVEGELVFANEPIVRIEAPLVEAQLIETALLNIVNYQTLIATKASRIKQIIPNEVAMEFGTRRAQEMDAAIWGTRAAVIGGFESTSNVRAGKLFDIPVAGMVKNDRHKTADLMTENDEKIGLDPKSEGFYLLQRIQDEVHRFAITFHRQVRSKNSLASRLERIQGVGPKTRIKLLRNYGSLKNISAASVEDLESLGISKKVAQTIKLSLKNQS